MVLAGFFGVLETNRGRDFNGFDFSRWSESDDPKQFAKLDCLFNYFQRISKNLPDEFVTFHRRVLSNEEKSQLSLNVRWCTSFKLTCF
jgi:hypothetical protein